MIIAGLHDQENHFKAYGQDSQNRLNENKQPGMRIPRIYLDQPLEAGTDTALDQRSCHYLANVLRMKAGMRLIAFNGSGLEYDGELKALSKKSGGISIGQGNNPGTESSLHTTLGIGLSRGERMDYVIQKSTELGVSVIQPLFTENCEVRLDEKRLEKRMQHWAQTSISACEQCCRVVLPVIQKPLQLADWLNNLPTSDALFLLDRDQTGSLADREQPDALTLLVGPEGGFSEQEKTLALGKGFSGINLGSRTLRTETAPIAALGVCQLLWGS